MDSARVIVLIIIFFGYLFTGIFLYNNMIYDNNLSFLLALLFAGGAISLLLAGIVFSIIYWGQIIIKKFTK